LNHERLEPKPSEEDNRRMSEDPTRNLSQDGLERILARLDSIDSRLGKLESQVAGVENRLSTLEEKVDRRLQETRSIWEQVLVRLDGFERRLDGFENELRMSLRRFERQVGLLAEDVMQARADQRDLDKRMDRLEPKTMP
jgi:archaellum component FlaC